MSADTEGPPGRDLDGRFLLGARIGRGGMGAVYRARQHSVDRDVAVKVISPDLKANETATRRFLREARLTAKLGHPNVVSVVDFGETDDGLLYLAMELLDGRTLREVIAAEAPLPPARAVGIAVSICDALEAAHRAGVVHRDLKPANVMLLDRDFVKVLDFGIARSLANDDTTLTGVNALMGTPAYLPPETCRGEDSDARADLYALGVLLHEMLTGRGPFPEARTPVALVHHHGYVEPRAPPELAPVLGNALMRLLRKDPSERFPDAATTREALVAALATLDGPDTEPVVGSRPAPVSRAPWIAAAGLLAALAVGVVWAVGRRPASTEGTGDPGVPEPRAALAVEPDTSNAPVIETPDLGRPADMEPAPPVDAEPKPELQPEKTAGKPLPKKKKGPPVRRRQRPPPAEKTTAQEDFILPR